MYTIKRAAELTGTPETTLRAWERRYGVVEPARTDAGYRLYDKQELDTLAVMRALVDDGWPARLAADEARRRLEDPARAGVARDDVAPGPDVASGDLDTLADAARALDPSLVSAELDRRLGVATFEAVADDWLLPALARLGERWADGTVSVAGEHLVAYAVQRRLDAAYEAAARRPAGPRVAVGLPPGARHELGLLAFSVAARRVGLDTIYLGADLPIGDWRTAVDRRGVQAAVLSVHTSDDLAAGMTLLEDLVDRDTGLLVAVGGARQDELDHGAIRLGHRVGPAAAHLAVLLGRTPQP